MLKKHTAIVLMITAYAILLVHNMVPHHHHDSVHDLTEHHHADHHQDNQEDTEGLNHLFSYLTHSTEGFTFSANHHISNTLTKQLFSMVTVIPGNYSPDKFLIPPLLHKPPAEHFIYISPHSLSSGLRAPPAI